MASSEEDDKIYGTLSNFEIEKKIGRGQFSVVYRAKCVANDQIVALKKVQVSELNYFLFELYSWHV
jgi:NIMA (never in mitosis gene a)-related kinase